MKIQKGITATPVINFPEPKITMAFTCCCICGEKTGEPQGPFAYNLASKEHSKFTSAHPECITKHRDGPFEYFVSFTKNIKNSRIGKAGLSANPHILEFVDINTHECFATSLWVKETFNDNERWL